jgi:hypothetical protein
LKEERKKERRNEGRKGKGLEEGREREGKEKKLRTILNSLQKLLSNACEISTTQSLICFHQTTKIVS